MVSMLLTIFFSVFLEEISTFKNKGLTVSRTRVQTLLINNFTYKFCRTISFFQPLFFYTIYYNTTKYASTISYNQPIVQISKINFHYIFFYKFRCSLIAVDVFQNELLYHHFLIQ